MMLGLFLCIGTGLVAMSPFGAFLNKAQEESRIAVDNILGKEIERDYNITGLPIKSLNSLSSMLPFQNLDASQQEIENLILLSERSGKTQFLLVEGENAEPGWNEFFLKRGLQVSGPLPTPAPPEEGAEVPIQDEFSILEAQAESEASGNDVDLLFDTYWVETVMLQKQPYLVIEQAISGQSDYTPSVISFFRLRNGHFLMIIASNDERGKDPDIRHYGPVYQKLVRSLDTLIGKSKLKQDINFEDPPRYANP